MNLFELKKLKRIQIHGHRGCRGLMPENTIPAFEYAIDLGVDAVELDVVITGDSKVLVSHEPWFSHEYCLDENGNPITRENEMSFNIFKMSYEQSMRFDCGKRKHLRFPLQKNFPAHKPLLEDVADVCLREKNNIFFIIELKSEAAFYNIYQPEPAVIVDEVMKVVKKKKVEQQCMLQSFDTNILKELHKKYPTINCALLVEEDANPEKDFLKLGFKPFGYNPFFKLLKPDIISYCKKNKVQISTWTVNEIEDMKQVVKMEVDGIITDYPDRAISILKQLYA